MPKILVLLCLISIYFDSTGAAPQVATSRQKRDVGGFSRHLSCMGVRWSRQLKLLNGYGCWCGNGGYGTAQDELDECCEAHDMCWISNRANVPCTGSEDPFFVRYDYECSRWSRDIKCKDADGTCARTICECDKAAAICIANANYNSATENIDRAVECGVAQV